jgi:oxygen-independent coproporphyrinogen-3 oxidase
MTKLLGPGAVSFHAAPISLTLIKSPSTDVLSLQRQPYLAYSYSYPHKSAYGPLDPPVPLEPVWQAERRDSLFLYLHIPFCEMRCGFCNLFTLAGTSAGFIEAYLESLERQASVLARLTAGKRLISRMAIGGGTPTFLSPPQLDRLLRIAERFFDASPNRTPTSVETSPKTASKERLEVLKSHGVERVSIGVQSFVEEEVHAIGRPQRTADVHVALERIRDIQFPILNIDLIYGQPTQTLDSWLSSVRKAMKYRPEELFLYPLYIRPQTGLGRHGQTRSDRTRFNQSCYREARALLTSEGYEQVSMRFFRLPRSADERGPVYCCQTDGMLGLGCGARSYTTRLHYASRFAVASADVQKIVFGWIEQTDDAFGQAHWGFRLSEGDRRRRFVIQSLLTREGLNEKQFIDLFGSSAEADLPQLRVLVESGLATRQCGKLLLTDRGLELSDAIGPSLYSVQCREVLERFTQP